MQYCLISEDLANYGWLKFIQKAEISQYYLQIIFMCKAIVGMLVLVLLAKILAKIIKNKMSEISEWITGMVISVLFIIYPQFIFKMLQASK